ncbi:MAG TPA: hypothetical protein VF503_00780 [Sphingobium sp.]|uniref:hypothetical protein n=1 Tax=Sphingobium sp. TaxID=1912891 RepID=UPI002ED0603C
MTPDSQGGATTADATILDPAPLKVSPRHWTRFVGPGISLLVLGAVLYQLRFLDMHLLWRMLPTNFAFWSAFLVAYMITPLSDWVIFRRLWNLPARGIPALMRKMVSNDLLLGYLGEVYFYTWARRNASISSAPFGAIKDVAILSALAGNVVTLLLVLFCWPFMGFLHRNVQGNSIEYSVLFVLGLSLVITFFRNRLFSLPAKELWIVTGIHMFRIFVSLTLTAYMWYCLMPDIDLVWLLLLNTMRLLVSRLPFIPNKDLAFAALAAFFVGHDNTLVAAMTLMASISLAAHLMVGAVLGALDLLKEGQTST